MDDGLVLHSDAMHCGVVVISISVIIVVSGIVQLQSEESTRTGMLVLCECG